MLRRRMTGTLIFHVIYMKKEKKIHKFCHHKTLQMKLAQRSFQVWQRLNYCMFKEVDRNLMLETQRERRVESLCCCPISISFHYFHHGLQSELAESMIECIAHHLLKFGGGEQS